MKYTYFRKASVIHAVKCNKTVDSKIALRSSEKLQEIMKTIEGSEENELQELTKVFEEWQKESPTVSDAEIKEIF